MRCIELFLVPANADGVSRTQMDTVDKRDHARVMLTNVAVSSEAHLDGMPSGELYEHVLNRACRASLEMLGVGCYSFEMTLDYLKTRKQFGKVIDLFRRLVIAPRSFTRPRRWPDPARKRG